jgi:hypothetical protein
LQQRTSRRLTEEINNTTQHDFVLRWVRLCFWIFLSTSSSWANPQGIFQKHWKWPYWVASERDQKIFYENHSIRGFFGFKSCRQNCFWNLLSISGLSQICKISNVWKFPSPFSRNTLISSFEKNSWNFKTSFWKKNYPINSKTIIENFFHN